MFACTALILDLYQRNAGFVDKGQFWAISHVKIKKNGSYGQNTLLTNGRIFRDAMNRAVEISPNDLPNERAALDVRIGGGKWISNSVYQTKDFTYDISNGSYLLVIRNMGGTEIYRARLYNRYNPPDDERNECLWSTDLGEYVCNLLHSYGYTSAQYSH